MEVARGCGVTAAHRPFEPGSGGSSPSGPIRGGESKSGSQQSITACSSAAERSADNRKMEVRLLPGRLLAIVGTKVLAAAHLALNQAGEGSSPSGPTRGMHWWSSRQDTALVRR